MRHSWGAFFFAVVPCLLNACGSPEDQSNLELELANSAAIESALSRSQGTLIAPNTYKHGPFRAENGVEVEVVEFLDTDTATKARPNQRNDTQGSECYSHRDAGWKRPVPWGIDVTNAPIDEATVQGVIEKNMAAWEDAARRDFFGGYDSSETANGVRFDSLGESLLAQTLLYSTRLQGAVRPYKWRITFNSDMPWSLEQDPLAYDFENVGAHEIGHAAGMRHASTTCPEETMYPYASKGEIVKRDLHFGDIAGISSLY